MISSDENRRQEILNPSTQHQHMDARDGASRTWCLTPPTTSNRSMCTTASPAPACPPSSPPQNTENANLKLKLEAPNKLQTANRKSQTCHLSFEGCLELGA